MKNFKISKKFISAIFLSLSFFIFPFKMLAATSTVNFDLESRISGLESIANKLEIQIAILEEIAKSTSIIPATPSVNTNVPVKSKTPSTTSTSTSKTTPKSTATTKTSVVKPTTSATTPKTVSKPAPKVIVPAKPFIKIRLH